jgi:hypothetical protein
MTEKCPAIHINYAGFSAKAVYCSGYDSGLFTVPCSPQWPKVPSEQQILALGVQFMGFMDATDLKFVHKQLHPRYTGSHRTLRELWYGMRNWDWAWDLQYRCT